jgi:Ca-activated chloride channel family protein
MRQGTFETLAGPMKISASFFATLLALLAIAPTLPAGIQERKPKQAEQQKSDDGPLRLHSDLVVVNLIVTDASGQYTHGLVEKDFTVSEDDRVQPINSFFAEEAPFAAAILIDTSGSMSYKFSLARAAAASFVDHIRENDQVAVYGFNNEIRMFQDFSDLHDISEYIWDAKAENMTRMYDCLFEALGALEKRPEKRKAILVISDGWDTTSHKATFDSVMKKALASGVTIYSVDLIDDSARFGGGSWVAELRRGMAEMKEFAEKTGGRYIHSPQGDKLEEEFINVVDELRNQYTITYYSTNSKRDGRWRRLGVNVSRPNLTTRTRKGYWAPKD